MTPAPGASSPRSLDASMLRVTIDSETVIGPPEHIREAVRVRLVEPFRFGRQSYQGLAIKLGAALNELRPQVDGGSWRAFVGLLGLNYKTAGRWMDRAANRVPRPNPARPVADTEQNAETGQVVPSLGLVRCGDGAEEEEELMWAGGGDEDGDEDGCEDGGEDGCGDLLADDEGDEGGEEDEEESESGSGSRVSGLGLDLESAAPGTRNPGPEPRSLQQQLTLDGEYQAVESAHRGLETTLALVMARLRRGELGRGVGADVAVILRHAGDEIEDLAREGKGGHGLGGDGARGVEDHAAAAG